jgi:hypothetical protein
MCCNPALDKGRKSRPSLAPELRDVFYSDVLERIAGKVRLFPPPPSFGSRVDAVSRQLVGIAAQCARFGERRRRVLPQRELFLPSVIALSEVPD